MTTFGKTIFTKSVVYFYMQSINCSFAILLLCGMVQEIKNAKSKNGHFVISILVNTSLMLWMKMEVCSNTLKRMVLVHTQIVSLSLHYNLPLFIFKWDFRYSILSNSETSLFRSTPTINNMVYCFENTAACLWSQNREMRNRILMPDNDWFSSNYLIFPRCHAAPLKLFDNYHSYFITTFLIMIFPWLWFTFKIYGCIIWASPSVLLSTCRTRSHYPIEAGSFI